jgi:hypothetical protein
MPRFTQPIDWRIVQPDPVGPVRIRMHAWLPVSIRTAAGNWVEFLTTVDTGASFSFMPTAAARSHGLPVPRATSRITLLTANGAQPVTVRDADYLLRFPRLPERTFDLRWLLRDDLTVDGPVLLGLHNTVDLLSILFGGTMRPDGFMGCMEFVARDA